MVHWPSNVTAPLWWTFPWRWRTAAVHLSEGQQKPFECLTVKLLSACVCEQTAWHLYSVKSSGFSLQGTNGSQISRIPHVTGHIHVTFHNVDIHSGEMMSAWIFLDHMFQLFPYYNLRQPLTARALIRPEKSGSTLHVHTYYLSKSNQSSKHSSSFGPELDWKPKLKHLLQAKAK